MALGLGPSSVGENLFEHVLLERSLHRLSSDGFATPTVFGIPLRGPATVLLQIRHLVGKYCARIDKHVKLKLV